MEPLVTRHAIERGEQRFGYSPADVQAVAQRVASGTERPQYRKREIEEYVIAHGGKVCVVVWERNKRVMITLVTLGDRLIAGWTEKRLRVKYAARRARYRQR